MKYCLQSTVLLLFALAAPGLAMARDTTLQLPVAEVLDPAYHQGKLDGSVRFYFAGQSTPALISQHGEGVANRKTNAVNKSDAEACRWVALTALVALQEAARKRGANAVVGITSYFKRNEFKSASQYECHAGALMAGVALKGTYAKVGGR